MSRTITVNIDVAPHGVPPIISVNQYDTDFTVVFSLYSSDGTLAVESGTTAAVSGTKPDGNAYTADCTINTTSKTVSVTGAVQMTAAAGKGIFELSMLKSGKKLSTANFILDVEPAAMDQDAVISDTTISRFEEVETLASQAAASAASAAASAASAANAAKTADYYISHDSNGMMLAKMTGGTKYAPTAIPSGTKNIYIDSDGVHDRNGTTKIRTVTADGNEKLALDTNAASTSVDGKLTAAIDALGWRSDVIVT